MDYYINSCAGWSFASLRYWSHMEKISKEYPQMADITDGAVWSNLPTARSTCQHCALLTTTGGTQGKNNSYYYVCGLLISANIVKCVVFLFCIILVSLNVARDTKLRLLRLYIWFEYLFYLSKNVFRIPLLKNTLHLPNNFILLNLINLWLTDYEWLKIILCDFHWLWKYIIHTVWLARNDRQRKWIDDGVQVWLSTYRLIQ